MPGPGSREGERDRDPAARLRRQTSGLDCGGEPSGVGLPQRGS